MQEPIENKVADNSSSAPKTKESLLRKLDKRIMFVPLCCIVILCFLFSFSPEKSNTTLENIRNFFSDQLGSYYILMGMGCVLCTMYMAISKYGDIKLGNIDKPQYGTFQWGAMIFTSTMAADILFFSLHEWALYYADPHTQTMGSLQDWAPTFALSHWGPIPWSFYIVLAIPFGFMLHVRGIKRQKFSEACHPLIPAKQKNFWTKTIDIISVFALLAGTSTTFSLATPLLATATTHILGIEQSRMVTILILLTIATVYTITIWFGMLGVAKLANICVYIFFILLAYFLFLGNETRYIIETGITAIGNLAQNFIRISTWMDPSRTEPSFPQNWTIFYWAYWMAWCIATPFFIGVISKGRTIRNTVFGGYFWGLAGTFASFIILGNYGLRQQTSGVLDVAGSIAATGDAYQAIINIFNTLPLPKVALGLLVITMIAFYATTFDAITMVISSYTYKQLDHDQEPDKRVRIYWAILFILLPIALVFAESSRQQLYSLSIIAAFPIGIIIILIAISFFKDANKYFQENKKQVE
ncbi:MAG: BCCT family transporter [Planctomycetes bacterium]|jgi:BCCT family betaine/carnitine transporter|nr:BCCT family transporter [Planctomycetota bacterium]